MLENPKKTIGAAVLIVLTTIPVYFRLGREFMPPLNEGTVLYMPTTLPGISVTEARNLLLVQDRILMTFPEVHTVFGKAGRAETSTDPAPFSMMETTIHLKPKEEWRGKNALVFILGAGAAEMAVPPHLARQDYLMRNSSPSWTRRCRFPATPTPGPCPSRDASTCSPPACARPSE